MSRRDTNFQKHYSDRASVTLKVLLDMDQVLCDFEGSFLESFKKKFPHEPCVELEDRDGFFIRDQYDKLKPGLSSKTADVYSCKGFFKDLPEIPGAVKAAKEMTKMEGVDVFICTAPINMYKYCLREKYSWVDKHLGREWVDRIILTKDKTMVYGHLLIDDRVNITGANKYPTWDHVVFSSDHNRRTDLRGKRRLENWTDGQWRDLIEEFKMRV